MASQWFFLVDSNSSSFSWSLLSTSALHWVNSSWRRRTRLSSTSSAPSASSRAAFSCSASFWIFFLALTTSWSDFPPVESWSERSLISSARFLFSLLTVAFCSASSSYEALNLYISVWKALDSLLAVSRLMRALQPCSSRFRVLCQSLSASYPWWQEERWHAQVPSQSSFSSTTRDLLLSRLAALAKAVSVAS